MIYSQLLRAVIEKIIPSTNFMYADWEEVRDVSMMKGKGDKSKYTLKYPLIVAQCDKVPQSVGENASFCSKIKQSFYIIVETKKEYTVEERDVETYEKKIYPLYKKLLEVLQNDRQFRFHKQGQLTEISHEVEHLYYKRYAPTGVEQNSLRDIVDAMRVTIEIEIKDYTL
jgi:hypothetical protein